MNEGAAKAQGRRVVVYTRRSTAKQPNSLQMQLDACRSHASATGATVVEAIERTGSGAPPLREQPELCEAIAACVAHHADLLVSAPDRLARNAAVAEQVRVLLADRGLRVVYVPSLESDRLAAALIDCLRGLGMTLRQIENAALAAEEGL